MHFGEKPFIFQAMFTLSFFSFSGKLKSKQIEFSEKNKKLGFHFCPKSPSPTDDVMSRCYWSAAGLQLTIVLQSLIHWLIIFMGLIDESDNKNKQTNKDFHPFICETELRVQIYRVEHH